VEIKKSYQADLEHRRGWFFLIGLAVSACLFALSLAISVSPGDEEVDTEMLEKIVQDMEFKPNKPADNMIAYQVPEPKTKEIKAKINVVEKKVVEEVPEQLVKSQEAQLDGEGAQKQEEDTKAIVPVAVDEKDNPLNFRVVERLPEFPGGPVEFMKWLTRNLNYPSAAQSRKIQGRVVVHFIVNKDGSVTDAQIKKSVEASLDREALRVVNMMPKWTPGKMHGEVCRTLFAIPIEFKI